MPRLHYKPGVLTIDLGLPIVLQFYLASGACFAIDYDKAMNVDLYPRDQYGPEIGMNEANRYFRQWCKRKEAAEQDDDALFAELDTGMHKLVETIAGMNE